MPELPEVETICRNLQELVIGKKINNVTVNWPKIIKLPIVVEQFPDALKGQTIQGIGRRGKFLLFYLDELVLVSHLRMEGRYGLYESLTEVEPHTHIIFHFEDQTELRYKDVRKFGTMHLFSKGEESTSLPLSQLGPEPFSKDFSATFLKERCQKTQRKIKAVLLDQTVVVGLGNIYVDEALFRASIHPERKANSLTMDELLNLKKEIMNTLQEALEKGGSSIRSYVNSNGELGKFQQSLFVYGRKGEECLQCGENIEKIVSAGRGTHFCPQCQMLG